MRHIQLHCGIPAIPVTVEGVYDGPLFYGCFVCGVQFHRFAPSDWRRPRAETWAKWAGVTLEEAP
jgi:hypothetical protein